MIMATPVVDCLRMHYPKARLVALTRTYSAKILDGHTSLDRIIPCDDKTWKGLRDVAAIVREEQPDAAILLPNSMRSYLPFGMAGVEDVVGYRRGFRKFYVEGPSPDKDENGYVPRPMVEYYLEICLWLGMEPSYPIRPTLFVPDELRKEADRLLLKLGIDSGDRVIGLNPGAKFGSSKCWPAGYFAKVAELLEADLDCKLLLFVGPDEDEIAERIMKDTGSKLINTGPEKIDLALLKPMIKRCDLLITNDTGPRHYATAFDLPVLVIMGPTDPRYTQYNLDKTLVLRKELQCSPCHKKICPYDHECMTTIRPEEVFEGALRLLDQAEMPA